MVQFSFLKHPSGAARFGVSAIFMANAILLSNWIARIPDVKERLRLNEAQLGVALLSMAVGALAAQILSGYALGRFGSRRVTMAMAVLFCSTATLPGAAPTMPLLMLALFCVGAANGALDVAMNGQAALVEKQHGRPIMASFHGLWSAGGMVGAALGGFAAARRVPVELHLCLCAVVILGMMLLVFRWLIPDAGHHTAS